MYFSALMVSFVYRCSSSLATLFGKLNVIIFLYFNNIVLFLFSENSWTIWLSFKMSKNSPRCMISLSQRKVWVNLFAWWGVQKVPRFGLATLKLVPNRLPYSLQSWQLSPTLIFMTFKTLSYHQSPPASGGCC
jgi:hypothetical protein